MVVLGPTASGKTALSLTLARHYSGEIVNCDSVAMYRELEIGTAKPTRAERAGVPHHLVDFVDPLCDVSAANMRGRPGRLSARSPRADIFRLSVEEPDSICALC